MFFDNLAGLAAHVLVADAAVVRALRSGGITVLREAERAAVLIEEIFLLEANPQIGIILDGGAHVGGMRRAVGVHDLAENDVAVVAGAVRVESHRLQNAVRALALGLHGGTAVEAPLG